MRMFGKALAVAALTLWGGVAHAIPVQWTFATGAIGVGDPGYLPFSGSFVFDADSGVYSDINVTTLAGATFAGNTYTTAGPTATATRIDLFEAGSPPLVLFLGLNKPLSNAGGDLFFDDFYWWGEYTCPGVDRCGATAATSLRGGIGILGVAILTGIPVPEPASVALLGAGVLGLALGRRRRTG